MQWFRRDAARNAAQKARSRVFTLGGLATITALLALIAALVAVPLRNARQQQMTSAARSHLVTLVSAIDEYRGQYYRLPVEVAQLEAVGYTTPPAIVVCRFDHVPDLRNFDEHLDLAVRHRASDVAIAARYPTIGGETIGESVRAEQACVDSDRATGSEER